jgi:hypothetical protein
MKRELIVVVFIHLACGRKRRKRVRNLGRRSLVGRPTGGLDWQLPDSQAPPQLDAPPYAVPGNLAHHCHGE